MKVRGNMDPKVTMVRRDVKTTYPIEGGDDIIVSGSCDEEFD